MPSQEQHQFHDRKLRKRRPTSGQKIHTCHPSCIESRLSLRDHQSISNPFLYSYTLLQFFRACIVRESEPYHWGGMTTSCWKLDIFTLLRYWSCLSLRLCYCTLPKIAYQIRGGREVLSLKVPFSLMRQEQKNMYIPKSLSRFCFTYNLGVETYRHQNTTLLHSLPRSQHVHSNLPSRPHFLWLHCQSQIPRW